MRQHGAYPVRPIVLLQAEARTSASSESFEKVKAALLKLGVPEAHIKIKTADLDELKGVALLSPACPVRYIITVNALAEGWDCSFAYILASLANRNSPVQVEQLLGRVLRQPHATPHPERLLNCSYVLTASDQFGRTLDNIVQGLELAGYTAADCRGAEAAEEGEAGMGGVTGELFRPPAAGTSPPDPLSKREGAPAMRGFESSGSPSPEGEGAGGWGAPLNDPNDLVPRIAGAPSLLERESGGEVPAEGDLPPPSPTAAIEAQATAAALAAEAVAARATTDPSTDPSALAMQAHTYPMRPAVAEAAAALRLPTFVVPGPGGLFAQEMPLSKEYLLQGFRLERQGTDLNFAQLPEALRVVDLEERADHSYTPTVRKADAQLREPLLAYFRGTSPAGQRKTVAAELARQLGRALRPLTEDDLLAYLDRVLLPFDAEQLREAFDQPARYAAVVREAIAGFTEAYAVAAFERQLDTGTLRTAPAYALPARRVALRPALPLPRSLYEREEAGNGLERAMMQLLADADNVTFWTRNPSTAPAGFRLNGPLTNHYPDFVAHTASGKVLLIETKGDDRNNPDSAYKRRLGAAWAAAAGPAYRYYMVFDQLVVPGAQRLGTFAGLLAEL